MESVRRRKTADDPTRGIYQRAGVYWLKMTHEKKIYFFSLDTSDGNEAVAKALEIRSDPEAYIISPGKWDTEVADFLRDKKAGSVKGLRRHKGASGKHTEDVLRWFHDSCDVDSADSVREHHIKGWLETFPNANTQKTYYARLIAFFNWARLTGRVRANPMADIPQPEVHPNKISKKDVIVASKITQLLRETKREDMKFVILMGCEAGFRKGEIIMSKPDWFVLETDSIHVPCPDPVDGWEPKNRKERTVPMSPRLKKFLVASGWLEDGRKYVLHPEARPEDWIFDQSSSDYRWDPKRPLENLFEKCKIRSATTHTMRHSFASHALMGGKSIWKVAEWLGDKPETVKATYAHFIPKKGGLDGVFSED